MGALVDIAAQGRLSAHRTSILTVAGQSKNALKYILTLWVLTMQTPVCYRCTQAETCRGGGGANFKCANKKKTRYVPGSPTGLCAGSVSALPRDL